MSSFLILLKKDLLEFKRNHKWLILIGVFSFISILSAITAMILPELFELVFVSAGMDFGVTLEANVGDSYLQFIANMGEMGLLVAMVLFAPILVKEKQEGTLLTLQNNGVSEAKVVLSHFISNLILLTVSYLISIGVLVSLNLLIFQEYAGIRGIVALLYVYLAFVFSLAISLFASSICKKKSTAYGLSIILYFLLFILSAIPYIDVYIPLYSLNLASNIITDANYIKSDYLNTLYINLAFIVLFVISSITIYQNRINNRK